MENRDVLYFDNLWQESSPKDGMKHTKETWDRIAGNLKKDPEDVRVIKEKQYNELSSFLKQKGVIDENSTVIDIGCGTGGFAAAFAKNVNKIVCSDISSVMLDSCRENLESQNLNNAEFLLLDFKNADLEETFGERKFDLVFTSLTPAMDGLDSIKRVNSISSGYCFNNSFVYRKDAIKNDVSENVFGIPASNRWGNSSSYCLFNILWNMGYTPEVSYYKECISHTYPLNEEFAFGVTKNIIRDRAPKDEEVKKTLEYLKQKYNSDTIEKTTESLFSWILWKV